LNAWGYLPNNILNHLYLTLPNHVSESVTWAKLVHVSILFSAGSLIHIQPFVGWSFKNHMLFQSYLCTNNNLQLRDRFRLRIMF
jgi:hypothetical protein